MPYFLQPCKRHAVTGSRSYTHWPRKVWLINLMENLTQWVDKHLTDTWHAHYNTFIRLSSTFRLDAVASICIQLCTFIFWGVRTSKSSYAHRWYAHPSKKDLSKERCLKYTLKKRSSGLQVGVEQILNFETGVRGERWHMHCTQFERVKFFKLYADWWDW